jgi:hypothetical protein
MGSRSSPREDNTARIWDVTRSRAITGLRTTVLAAALARGIGWRTDRECADLLMQDAPDDLYAEALQQLGRTPEDREIADAAAALAAPLHPNCYLSPTQFAAKFAGVRRHRRHLWRCLLLTLAVFALAGIATLICTDRIDAGNVRIWHIVSIRVWPRFVSGSEALLP